MLHLEAPTSPGHRMQDRDPLLGAWLDAQFQIETRLATGGFGSVYRARTAGGQRVAVKVLHPWLTTDANMVARFCREAQTMLRLHDRHTVTTLAIGETADAVTGDPLHYIAMELLTGESLHDRLQRAGVLAWQDAIAIARAVCSSLAEAHALGVVHRDLKPANIHIEPTQGTETVKVIDFGVAKIARGSEIDDGRELTYAGHMIGTYDYMSPEQIVGDDCQPTSDVYALGLVMYEMLTGRRPFAATGPASMMAALLTQTPAPPSVHAAIPAALDRIVMRCLEREPDARFAGMPALAAALHEVVRARHTLEEITVVRPVVDDLELEPATLPGRPSQAYCDGAPTRPSRPAPVIRPPAPTRSPTAGLRPPSARGSSPAISPYASELRGEQAPLGCVTLPGLAVAPRLRSRHAQLHAVQPQPASIPPASIPPAAFPPPAIPPPAFPRWIPAPAAAMPAPPELMACGSHRQPQACESRMQPQVRSRLAAGGAIWLALVIACATTITLAAVL